MCKCSPRNFISPVSSVFYLLLHKKWKINIQKTLLHISKNVFLFSLGEGKWGQRWQSFGSWLSCRLSGVCSAVTNCVNAKLSCRQEGVERRLAARPFHFPGFPSSRTQASCLQLDAVNYCCIYLAHLSGPEKYALALHQARLWLNAGIDEINWALF